jgi:hypothetical protein
MFVGVEHVEVDTACEWRVAERDYGGEEDLGWRQAMNRWS